MDTTDIRKIDLNLLGVFDALLRPTCGRSLIADIFVEAPQARAAAGKA